MPHACRPPPVSRPSGALGVAARARPQVHARPGAHLARLSVGL
jgi:hypothetical protein